MTGPTRREFIGTVGAAAFASHPIFERRRSFNGMLPAHTAGEVRLNYNESAYGPSPKALAVLRSSAADLAGRYYPSDTFDPLRDALAKLHGVTRAHIRLGAGSTEIIKACDDVFLGTRGRLVAAEPAYEAVVQYAANSKAETALVPLTTDHRHDLPRMAAAAKAGAGLLYVCNPNNPTGTIVRGTEINALIGVVPSATIVLIDEAYAEFVSDSGYESAVRHVKEGRNVIVTKTFSKIHGMAGLRIGYAIAKPELIDRLAPFTVDFANVGIAVNAAIASLDDPDHRAMAARENAKQRTRFNAEMKSLGFDCAESHANFVMVNVRRSVKPLIAAMAAKQILVGREFAAMPTFVRVTLGTATEMDAFYPAFREAIRA